ncbi:hypothetical protein Tco_1052872, partial [Tanacetum coccineum]
MPRVPDAPVGGGGGDDFEGGDPAGVLELHTSHCER